MWCITESEGLRLAGPADPAAKLVAKDPDRPELLRTVSNTKRPSSSGNEQTRTGVNGSPKATDQKVRGTNPSPTQTSPRVSGPVALAEAHSCPWPLLGATLDATSP